MGGRGGRGRALPQVGWENGIHPPPPTEQLAPAPAPAVDRLRDVVATLTAKHGDYLMISDVRAALSDLSRDDVDAALRDLLRDPNVHIVPESNQKVLTAEERAGAIEVGNQTRHLIRIDTPLDTGAHNRITAGGVATASDADLAMAQRDPATTSALYDAIRAEVRRRRAT